LFNAHLDLTSKLEIPTDKLGVGNPILHYGEITLFEDELGDKGSSRVNVRFRIMNDCFFVLMRSYTRVDHVLVRILDTRVYHEFGADHLIRDFQHRECTYTQLKSKGFSMDSQWGLSPNQSDEVYNSLDLKMKHYDVIKLI
jgi:type 2A phosphatase activator TIP41